MLLNIPPYIYIVYGRATADVWEYDTGILHLQLKVHGKKHQSYNDIVTGNIWFTLYLYDPVFFCCFM